MATVNFFLREPQADADTPIILRLNDSVNGQKVRIKIPTGEKIHPKRWDQTKQKVKGTGSPELNGYLESLARTAKSQYLKMRTDGTIPEPAALRAAIFPEKAESALDPGKQFTEAFRSFVEVQSHLQHARTVRKYNSLLTSLEEFSSSKRFKITFESIDLKFYEAYKIFLLNRKGGRYGDKGLVDDTVAKYMSTLKTFMAWALERKYHTNVEYQQFKAPRKAKNDIVTLSEEELLRVYSLDLSNNPRLERVRDLFCFGCFTGQRWSDVEAFNKENIKGNTWDFISFKTKKRTQIPFVGFAAPARDILRKYGDDLPKISNQKFNDYIKEVGQLAEINSEVVIKRYSGKKLVEVRRPKHEFMASHMARRSFVTILLQRGIPPTTIMKFTGHTDLKTLMKYENTSQEAAVKALEQVGRIGESVMRIA